MGAIKYKIFFILSVLAAIFLLEISLRFAGYIYYRMKIPYQEEITENDRGGIRILCLGDSVTFGLGAERGRDYPAQLERILNEGHPYKKFVVYNQGYPGRNSSQILKYLEENIEKYKPNIIVLLAGNNNRFNLVDSNYHLFEDGVYGKLKMLSSRLDILLMHMRAYKLLKIAILRSRDMVRQKISPSIKDEKAKYSNLKNTTISPQLNPDYQEKLDLANEYYKQREFNMAIEQLDKILAQDQNNPRALVLLGEAYIELEKYDLALAKLEKAIINYPEDAWAHSALGKMYYRQGRNNHLIKEKNFELAVKELKKSVSYPSHSKDKVRAYYTLAELFFEQGKVNLATIAIKNALGYEPDNFMCQKLLRMVSLDSNETPQEIKIFNKLLYYDLDYMAKIARNHRIDLILLGYPDVLSRNEIREQIANKYNIPFIDFVPIFSELLTKYQHRDLFSNDAGHPNSNGYRILAKTIARIIIDGNKNIKGIYLGSMNSGKGANVE
jgi:lysophospholipase L1-like esterase